MPRFPAPNSEDIRVIFVGFNALADHDLHLDELIAAIEGELDSANAAGALPIHADAEGRTDSLQAALLTAPRAQVLHFSAHGHPLRGLMLHDGEGRSVMASGQQLVELLGRYRNLKLIVLHGCHQKSQADALKAIFDCVLATSGTIDKDASRQFMRAFYKGLAHGESVGAAFQIAEGEVAVVAPKSKGQFWLIPHEGIDPDWIRLHPVRGRRATRQEVDASVEWLRETVTSFDDVVITANVTDWTDAVPVAAGVEPHVIDIPVPDRKGGWQRDWPPQREEWAAIAAKIDEVAASIKRGTWKRVHVVVHLPFGLSALLVKSLEAMNHELIIYQWTPPSGRAEASRRWQPWGPGASEAMPPPDRRPFFKNVRWPDRAQSQFEGDIALTVGVSRPIARDLVFTACGNPSRVRLVPLIPIDGAGQASLDQRNIGRAAEQLADALQTAAARFPRAAAIHLFVCAPKALLMRAVLRQATSPVRVVLHEFFADAKPSACYLPLTDLGARAAKPKSGGADS